MRLAGIRHRTKRIRGLGAIEFGWHGSDEPVVGRLKATPAEGETSSEGEGVYIAKTKKLASGFGSCLLRLRFDSGRTLKVHNEIMPMLHAGEFEQEDLLAAPRTPWTESNIEAMKKCRYWETGKKGGKEFVEAKACVRRELPRELKRRGFDSIDVQSGDRWWVVFDQNRVEILSAEGRC